MGQSFKDILNDLVEGARRRFRYPDQKLEQLTHRVNLIETALVEALEKLSRMHDKEGK